jgi:hypothetical protein
MNESEFWNLIESARRSASTVDEATTCLVNHLKEMSVSEIVDFGRHYRNANRMAYDERLWVAAITISEHYTSDDVFSDFCDWLVAQGKEVFDRALADPDSLADLELVGDGDGIGSEGFSMASVAFKAYETKTGRKDFSQVLGLLPPPKLKNANSWDGKPETLEQIVPRLYAKFGEKS